MDSSRSLRDSTDEDNRDTDLHSPKAKSESWKGSDPNQVRGKILFSSLKLLRGIAQQSKSDFQVNLRNFGDNLTRSKSLMSKWIDWTNKTSDADLQKFVQNALFAESSGTNWDKGLETARSAISQRLGESPLGEIGRAHV